MLNEGSKMVTEFDKYLDSILATFDLFDLEDEYVRRVVVKPLYDYFQSLILEVAEHLCSMNRNAMKIYHLKTRWDMIKSALWLVENPTQWDALINQLQNACSSVEHTDYESPNKASLASVRNQAPEFKKWILAVGNRYYAESQGFSFIQEYLGSLRWYISQAKWNLQQYGDEPPYSVKRDIVMPSEQHPYKSLKSLVETVDSRISEIHKIDDLKRQDIENLVKLIRETKRLDAKEDVLLHSNICPKCGGKIVDTQRSVGGNVNDPMPTAIICRVGCEKCDYELNSETIDV